MASTSTLTTHSLAIRITWLGAAILAWLWQGELVALVEHASDMSVFMRVFIYSVVYVTLAGLNVPGAVLLTLLAGPLFGTAIGAIVASFVSTLGALLAFLLNRHFLSSYPQHTGSIVIKLPNVTPGFHWSRWSPTRIGTRELLLMRLVPVIPFFAVNLLAGRSHLSAGKFWLVSQIGMLPATVLLVHAGAALSNL